jgi:glucose/arabinose dehydrogenase
VYVTEQRGVVRLVKDGRMDAAPALDITDEVGADAAERGLLCIAFPPDYEAKGFAFLDFTDTKGDTRICRVRRSSSDRDRFDPSTLQTILKIAQPYANHNGGQIVFGPDGYLYIGMGDGGSARDPQNRAQNKRQLLGKILRIDTENAPPKADYAVPKDNPFADGASGRPEVWLYGLRNPWRFSFDPTTRNLWIADVGQGAWEEVDVVAPDAGGANLGWALYEGDHLMNASRMVRKGYLWPVAEYSHAEGESITGGYVYRGKRYPRMQGLYVFGDFVSGRIWTLDAAATEKKKRLAARTNYGISTFGVDGDGELWVADWNRGVLHRVGDLRR